MGTDILSSEIGTNSKTTKTKTAKSTKISAKKTGDTKPSLFDQILAKSKKTVSKDPKTTSKVEIKSQPKQKDTIAKPDTKPTSLLDKMVKDIKVKQTSKKEQEKIVDAKKTVKSEVKLQQNSNKSVKKRTNEEVVEKTEVKSKTIKNETKDITKTENKIKENNKPDNKSKIKSESKNITNIKQTDTKNISDTKPERESLFDTLTKTIKTDIKSQDKITQKQSVGKQSVEKKPTEKIKSDQVVNKSTEHPLKLDIATEVSNQTDIKTKDTKKENQKQVVADKTTKKDNPTKSLLDSLIAKTTKKISVKTTKTADNTVEDTEEKSSLKAQIFLKDQNIKKQQISDQKKQEAKEILSGDNKSVESVKKSAKILELNIDDIEIDNKTQEPKSTQKSVTSDIKEQYQKQNQILDKVFLNKFQLDNNITKQQQILETQKTDATVSTSKNSVEEKVVNVSVDNSMIQTFTTKIVESKQKLGSFMSDLARKMYQNYKPPVTAFRFNLTPSNLGNISVTMKSDKANNSLSVSLKMNKQNTLDVFVDSKGVLQNALMKSFESSANVSLSLDMQNSDEQSGFEDFNQQKQKNKQEPIEQDSISEQVDEESTPIEDKSYM